MGGCLWNVSVCFVSVESDIKEYTRKGENRREEKIDSECKQNEAIPQATDTHR